MYIFLVLLCKNPELMSLSVATYPVYLVEGLVIFATVTTFWTCGVSRVTVQVVKTGLTPQIAPSDRLREAETVQRHPARPLHTPL